LHQNKDINGYPKVGLPDGNHLVHVLVLTAFRGSKPEGKESLHKDGNIKNPKLSNLRWGTHLENVREGNRCKLKDKHVNIIIRSKKSGAELARQFGVDRSTINMIRKLSNENA
jgi:hypothetical protein